jgi:large subunit ribosomal protein L1
MGKKRIAVLGEEETKENLPQDKKERKSKKINVEEGKHKIVKSGKQHGHLADVGAEALKEAEVIEEKEKELESEITKDVKKEGQEAKKEAKPVKIRSKKYLQAKKEIDKNKFYPLSESIKLLKKVSISHFNGSVDVHLNVKETGLKGDLEFPHPTGKTQVVKIADEQLINDLEKGKVNFTILITTPQMMPKLAKFAKLLGPKGLMPNPKSGTISDQPEETAKKIIQKTQFRTETKVPLIHLSIGKVNDSEKNLEENLKALVKTIGKRNIQKVVLSPTMGPSLKVDLGSL